MASFVVADAGPLHYLILIDRAEILSPLCGHVFIPFAVQNELLHSSAPAAVKNWLLRPPPWLEVVPVSEPRIIRGLHRGEAEALQLALHVKADTVLMDDFDGRTAAKRLGLKVVGTIGLLERAAELNLIILADSLGELRQTNFFGSEEHFAAALERERLWKEKRR